MLGISVPGFTAWPSCASRGFCSEEANLPIFRNIIVYGKRYKEKLIWDAQRTGANKPGSPRGFTAAPGIPAFNASELLTAGRGW